jgi:hypothetical protein
MNKTALKFFLMLLMDGLLLAGMFYYLDNTDISYAATQTRYVAPGAQCGSMSPCYANVQAAVDAANTGDEIRVAAGVYTGVSTVHGETQVVYLDKTLTIRGGYSTSDWSFNPTANPTILDAQGQGRVLFITGEIAPVIEGLRLRKGSALNGGGVYIHTATVTLQQTLIYSNTAGQWGGGVYLENSPSTIAKSQIYSNTTGSSGHGGGLALWDSPATLDNNVITGNRANVGGGIELNNNSPTSGAKLNLNIVENNIAFDYVVNSTTYDGAGGGIDINSAYTDTLVNNTIRQNTGKWGGGLHLFNSPAILLQNTIQENYAPYHGGGLYVQGNQPSITYNRILTNTADSWGGGMLIWVNEATISNNTFQGNTAHWRGGGLYAQSAAEFDSNLFQGNTATEQGGGVFIYHDVGADYQNNVFVDNQAAEGGGIYLWGGVSSFIHTTISDNHSGDGKGVVIDKYPGLVDPGAPTIYTTTVVFSNAIFANQTVGVFATVGNTLTIDKVLWHNTPTHVQAMGVNLTLLNEYSGDPAFQADGYHLGVGSAPRGKGVSTLDHDIDGQLREWGNQKDLGADEYMNIVLIDPEIGASLTYTNPEQGVTITLSVPPDAISVAMALMFAPFPPLPPEVMDSPYGKFAAIGPPFRLNPFHLDDPLPPVTDPVGLPLDQPSSPLVFGYPATLTLQYSPETLKQFREAMDSLELQLLYLLDNLPQPPQDPACGLIDNDLKNLLLDVPICDTGFPPPTTQSTRTLQYRLLTTKPDYEFVYYVFAVEIEETKVYLPLVVR